MLEFEAINAWFGRLTPVLVRFTRDRNLMVTKYPHNTPAWRFAFAHPRAGHGAVDLWRLDETKCRINAVAWVDEKQSGRRYLRDRASVDLYATDEEVDQALNAALDELLSWDPQDQAAWRCVEPPYRSKLRLADERKRPPPSEEILPTARPRNAG